MDFFNFDRMITPTLIKVVFWIGLAASVLFGLGLLIGGGSSTVRIIGLVYLVLGPLMVRVYCEVLIVVFKMHETLHSIDDSLKNTSRLDQVRVAADAPIAPEVA